MMTGKTYYFLAVFLISLFLISCKKEKTKDKATSCYDEAFYQQHKNDICLTDCPGVIGCDGKNYCNECIMHAAGIPRTQ
jgi:hypothetical protein